MRTDLEAFEQRRHHVHGKIVHHLPAHLRGRFLDIGCGTGNAIVAALQAGFVQAVGVDRGFQEFGWFDRREFDAICTSYGVDFRRALVIEADIFGLNLVPGSFDCIVMFDSIEHVPEPARFIKYAAELISSDGVLLIDTCQLYYSKSGHHLFSYIDSEEVPWAHLRKDFCALVADRGIDSWSWERFIELNRITHEAVKIAMVDAGLIIVDEHRSTPTEADRRLLETHREYLVLDGVDEDTLFEDWMLLAGRRPQE